MKCLFCHEETQLITDRPTASPLMQYTFCNNHSHLVEYYGDKQKITKSVMLFIYEKQWRLMCMSFPYAEWDYTMKTQSGPVNFSAKTLVDKTTSSHNYFWIDTPKIFTYQSLLYTLQRHIKLLPFL